MKEKNHCTIFYINSASLKICPNTAFQNIKMLPLFVELVKSITDGARRKCPWGAK